MLGQIQQRTYVLAHHYAIKKTVYFTAYDYREINSEKILSMKLDDNEVPRIARLLQRWRLSRNACHTQHDANIFPTNSIKTYAVAR